jgi:hypothetical protein
LREILFGGVFELELNGPFTLGSRAQAVTSTAVNRVVLGATVGWSLLGAASALPAMFACMMFDAPGSENRWATWALVGAITSFPIVCIVAILEARASRRAGNFSRACWCAGLPLVNLLVGGAAAAWIEIVQGGRLAG